MDKKIEDILLEATDSSSIRDTQLIQNLWSNYGQLNRVLLDKLPVIIKLIQFPQHSSHPRGWNSNISHERKVKSYRVEMNWYQHYNEENKRCYSPRLIKSGEVDDIQYLILEDLQSLKYRPKATLHWREVQLCLKWLANFHAQYMFQPPDRLWETGTYWHLDTRP